MLNTLRWSNEIRDVSALNLPAEGVKAAGIKDAEMKMAEQLIADMTVTFDSSSYTDHFADAVRALIEQRVAAGKTEKVEPLEEGEAKTSSNVIDLTALLKQSLGTGRGSSSETKSAANDEAADDAADKAAPAAKQDDEEVDEAGGQATRGLIGDPRHGHACRSARSLQREARLHEDARAGR